MSEITEGAAVTIRTGKRGRPARATVATVYKNGQAKVVLSASGETVKLPIASLVAA